MRKITKVFSFITVFMLVGTFVFAISIETIYKNIKAMSLKYTPDHYVVRVYNDKFEEALKDLPPDVLIGGKKPEVVIVFNRGKGVKIEIRNIKEEYKNLFSMYEEYFKFSGISKVQNPSEFKDIMDAGVLSVYKEDNSTVVVKAYDPEKKEKKDDYALFYLDKKMWIIKKAIYYIDGTPYVESINSYKKIGKYYLPYKIVLNPLTGEGEKEVFYFKDYKF